MVLYRLALAGRDQNVRIEAYLSGFVVYGYSVFLGRQSLANAQCSLGSAESLLFSLFALISGVSSRLLVLDSPSFSMDRRCSASPLSLAFRADDDESFVSLSDNVDGRAILNGNRGKFSTCGVCTATISVCVLQLPFTSCLVASGSPLATASDWLLGNLYRTLMHWIMSRMEPCNCCT